MRLSSSAPDASREPPDDGTAAQLSPGARLLVDLLAPPNDFRQLRYLEALALGGGIHALRELRYGRGIEPQFLLLRATPGWQKLTAQMLQAEVAGSPAAAQAFRAVGLAVASGDMPTEPRRQLVVSYFLLAFLHGGLRGLRATAVAWPRVASHEAAAPVASTQAASTTREAALSATPTAAAVDARVGALPSDSARQPLRPPHVCAPSTPQALAPSRRATLTPLPQLLPHLAFAKLPETGPPVTTEPVPAVPNGGLLPPPDRASSPGAAAGAAILAAAQQRRRLRVTSKQLSLSHLHWKARRAAEPTDAGQALRHVARRSIDARAASSARPGPLLASSPLVAAPKDDGSEGRTRPTAAARPAARLEGRAPPEATPAPYRLEFPRLGTVQLGWNDLVTLLAVDRRHGPKPARDLHAHINGVEVHMAAQQLRDLIVSLQPSPQLPQG